MAEFQYTELLPLGEDKTTYRKISDSGFKIEKLGNKEFLVIEPETIVMLPDGVNTIEPEMFTEPVMITGCINVFTALAV